MKKLVLLFVCFSWLFGYANQPNQLNQNQKSKQIDFMGELGGINALSLTQKTIIAYYCGDYVQVMFNTSIQDLSIEIQNDETSEILYSSDVDTYMQKDITIPIDNWASGSYTIYILNPINGCYMYGAFDIE